MPKLPIGDIGPCLVVWDYPDNQLAIGPYLGTVSLRMVDSISHVEEEGYGDAPLDGVFAGAVVELDVPMTRSSLLQLEATIAYEEMGDLTGSVLKLQNVAGCDMYQNAKQIVIAPLCNNVADDDTHKWSLLYKCHPWRDFELTWDRSGQRIHMVKFKVFPNTDSGCGGDYGTEGMASGSPAITSGICVP